MDTIKQHDGGLIVAGVVLIIASFAVLFAPGLTLLAIALIASVAFLVSGVFDIVNFVRFHKSMNLSGWAVVYAALDIILGLILLVHPLIFSAVIPWIVGAFFLVYGIVEAIGSFQVRSAKVSRWGWMLFSGIVGVLCGMMFFVIPETFSIFLSVFLLVRGVSLVVYGWNAGKVLVV